MWQYGSKHHSRFRIYENAHALLFHEIHFGLWMVYAEVRPLYPVIVSQKTGDTKVPFSTHSF